LYSLTGKELFTSDLSNKTISLNLSEYAEGIYFFTIKDRGIQITKQIIKL